MATLREIITEFVFKGDTKKLEQIEKSAKGLKSSFQELNPLVKTSLKLFAGFQVLRVAKKLISIGNEWTKLAEDAVETQNKFDVVFSKVNEKAKMFAENLRKNYGLARNESNKLLSDTGDLLSGFGFTQEKALELSNEVQKMAVDLASFTNIQGGSTRASIAITKALIGEKESLKLLGIAILDSDVKREASIRGITTELTRQQKAQITLDLIIRQSKNSIGDYTRTSDSASNRSKLLTKRFNDLKIAIGTILSPIRQFIIEIQIRLVNAILIILPWVKILGLGILGLVGILAILKAQMIITALSMALSWAIAFAPLIGMVALITAIALAIGLLIDDIIAFFQGRNSVTGIILQKFKDFGTDVIKVFTFIGEKIWELLSAPFTRIVDFAKNSFNKVKNIFGKDEKGEPSSDFITNPFGQNLAPKTSNNNSSSTNNSAIVQSPKITVNIDNSKGRGQTLIKDVSTGIENGLQNSLNQSLRTMI